MKEVHGKGRSIISTRPLTHVLCFLLVVHLNSFGTLIAVAGWTNVHETKNLHELHLHITLISNSRNEERRGEGERERGSDSDLFLLFFGDETGWSQELFLLSELQL